jgi:hypothetical protein
MAFSEIYMPLSLASYRITERSRSVTRNVEVDLDAIPAAPSNFRNGEGQQPRDEQEHEPAEPLPEVRAADVSELVREELVAQGWIPRGLRLEAAVSYLAGACISVLVWWLETGAEAPATDVAALLRDFAADGVLPGAEAAGP